MTLLLGGGFLTTGTPAQAQEPERLPIVFVHGYLGSGAQYRTQAMRFASNGWPAERISAIDYTGFTATMLDSHINAVRERFGVDKVYVAAHSLGTAVMASYLANPAQAAKVAAYAALDGIAATCSGGTRCTAITAASMGQSHVEAATSAESFRRQYVHFTGQEPETADVLPEDEIEIGGKVLEFSTNAPIAGLTGEVYEVNPDSGLRKGWPDGAPEAEFNVGADGTFGPISGLDGEKTYEIAITHPNPDLGTIHFYYQPFIRSTYILRLQMLTPTNPTYTNTNRGPNHSAAVALRYREWWAGGAAATRDTLEVRTWSWSGIQEPTNVLSRTTSNAIAGIHLHDDAATPRQTTLNALPYFSTQPFQTGMDLYIPSNANGPNGIVRFTNIPRGDTAHPQVINALNWPSDHHGILVEFNDFVQD